MTSSFTSWAAAAGARIRSRRLGAAGFAVAAVFAVLVVRFWHPYYGFTKFIQADSSDAAVAIHEFRENPVYFYPGFDGYDGSAYAQIAFHPLLDSPELKRAIGNVPYRARRILGSAIAWLLSEGRSDLIANRYAELNIGIWLILAALLWTLFPVGDWRGWAAWTGLLFSAGALHSVRLALTDLPSLMLFAAAMLASEQGKRFSAVGFLAVAGLARETAIGGVVGLWTGPWNSFRAWLSNALRLVAVAGPLAAWVVYVRWKAGPAPQGFGNFTWPIVGIAEKCAAALSAFSVQPQFLWVDAATLLAFAGLVAQAAYIVRRPEWDNAWWRVGAVGVVMMMLFGSSVWEGNPGAATRVLLPMELAFAVLVVRRRASWPWILAGGLSVFSGILFFVHVPEDSRELAAGKSEHGAYVVRLGDGWFGRESSRRHVWSWTQGKAELEFAAWPRTDKPLRATLGVRALSERTVEVRQDGKVLWSGRVGPLVQWVELEGVRADGPHLLLSTDAGPIREGGGEGARLLGLAVYDPRIE